MHATRDLVGEARSLLTRDLDVIKTVSPRDAMWNGGSEAYFDLGLAALHKIALARCAGPAVIRPVVRALDFGCGHGRVLRFIKAAWLDARLTACDVDREAVDFCAETFGAQPVYSDPDPDRIELDETFNLIWCGSVFTHLDEPRWAPLLDWLVSHLEPRSYFIFTTAGRASVRDLRRGDWFPRDRLAAYEETGFGYMEYPNMPGYGQSASSLQWVLRQLKPFPLRVIMASECAWARQDLIACMRERPGVVYT